MDDRGVDAMHWRPTRDCVMRVDLCPIPFFQSRCIAVRHYDGLKPPCYAVNPLELDAYTESGGMWLARRENKYDSLILPVIYYLRRTRSNTYHNFIVIHWPPVIRYHGLMVIYRRPSKEAQGL
jgi:hypothetical protein